MNCIAETGLLLTPTNKTNAFYGFCFLQPSWNNCRHSLEVVDRIYF